MFPLKVLGSVGCVRMGKPADMVFPVGVSVEAQAADGSGQRSGKNAAKDDSAKKGGFSQSPCAPWFHDESWNMPYPARMAVLVLPNGFHASPMRGSKAVLSHRTPTRPSEFCPGIRNLPLAKSKFDCRFCASTTGLTIAQAKPKFSVKFGVTRQSSCT